MRALHGAALLLCLARCSVDGNATSPEEPPELQRCSKSSALQWCEVEAASEVRRAIARLLVEGGTAGMSSQPPRSTRRCRPERDAAC